MISTSSAVDSFDEAQARTEIENLLQRKDIKKALEEKGVSAEEISSRLASLSHEELRQLSSHIRTAQAGGDILITILVIVLIIFLIKRI